METIQKQVQIMERKQTMVQKAIVTTSKVTVKVHRIVQDKIRLAEAVLRTVVTLPRIPTRPLHKATPIHTQKKKRLLLMVIFSLPKAKITLQILGASVQV